MERKYEMAHCVAVDRAVTLVCLCFTLSLTTVVIVDCQCGDGLVGQPNQLEEAYSNLCVQTKYGISDAALGVIIAISIVALSLLLALVAFIVYRCSACARRRSERVATDFTYATQYNGPHLEEGVERRTAIIPISNIEQTINRQEGATGTPQEDEGIGIVELENTGIPSAPRSRRSIVFSEYARDQDQPGLNLQPSSRSRRKRKQISSSRKRRNATRPAIIDFAAEDREGRRRTSFARISASTRSVDHDDDGYLRPTRTGWETYNFGYSVPIGTGNTGGGIRVPVVDTEQNQQQEMSGRSASVNVLVHAEQHSVPSDVNHIYTTIDDSERGLQSSSELDRREQRLISRDETSTNDVTTVVGYRQHLGQEDGQNTEASRRAILLKRLGDNVNFTTSRRNDYVTNEYVGPGSPFPYARLPNIISTTSDERARFHRTKRRLRNKPTYITHGSFRAALDLSSNEDETQQCDRRRTGNTNSEGHDHHTSPAVGGPRPPITRRYGDDHTISSCQAVGLSGRGMLGTEGTSWLIESHNNIPSYPIYARINKPQKAAEIMAITRVSDETQNAQT